MDILGNTRTASSEAEIVSSEYTRIVIGRAVSLCQSFSGSYQQQADAVMEIGSPEIRWVTGFAQGQANVSNIVGKSGFFQMFGNTSCGRISAMSVTANQGQRCATFPRNGQGTLRFRGAVITGFNFDIRSGRAMIMSGATLRFTGLEED